MSIITVSPVQTNEKSQKIKTAAKVAAGAVAIGAAVVAGKQLKGISVDNFVKKGGFIDENGIAKITNKKGRTKNFTGKIIDKMKNEAEKITETFKFKKGELTGLKRTEKMADENSKYIGKVKYSKAKDGFNRKTFEKDITSRSKIINREKLKGLSKDSVHCDLYELAQKVENATVR